MGNPLIAYINVPTFNEWPTNFSSTAHGPYAVNNNEPYSKLCHKIKMASLVGGPLIFSSIVMYGNKISF